MEEKSPIKYVKIDNRVIFSLNRNKSEKRALAIYVYLSYTAKNSYAIPIDLSKIMDLLNMNHNTSSKKSLQAALSALESNELAEFYSSKKLNESMVIEDLSKDANRTIWSKPYISESEMHFTLIPINYIEDIIFSEVDESVEDMILTLAYICAKTERRNSVSPVMWFGLNNIASEIHIDSKKFVRVANILEEMEIVYFKKANLSKGRKNYIYGLYHDRDYVDHAVSIAEKNNVLDRRVKSKIEESESTGMIEPIEGNDFAVDPKLSDFFSKHGLECNEGIMIETNKFYHKHGRVKLLDMLGGYNPEVLNADNKVGAFRSILQRNY